MTSLNYLAEQDTPLRGLQHIPGERGWPVVGKLPAMVKDLNGLLHHYHRQYGDVVRHDIGVSMNGVVLLGPDHYKRILLDTQKNFSAQAGYAKTIGVFYGGGLLMRDFDDHRFNRRAFQAAFKTTAMKGYADLMNPIIERTLPEWENSRDFLFFPQVKQMLLATASKVFFGVDDLGDDAQKLNQAFIDVVERGIMAILRLREESVALNRSQLAYEDLDKLEGLDRAFHEAIRLHPSVPLLQRRTIRECEFSGHRIPANTLLFVPPQFSHTMDQWWDEPMKFDPDRFLPERNEHKRHSHSYVPFGGGAHKCVGMYFAVMNAKCFMHQFLLRHRFFVPEGYMPKMQTLPLPKPGDNLPIKLSKIS